MQRLQETSLNSSFTPQISFADEDMSPDSTTIDTTTESLDFLSFNQNQKNQTAVITPVDDVPRPVSRDEEKGEGEDEKEEDEKEKKEKKKKKKKRRELSLFLPQN